MIVWVFHSQINLIWFPFSVNNLPPATTPSNTPRAQFPGLQTQFCDGISIVSQKLEHLSSSPLWPTKHYVLRITSMASSSLLCSSVPCHHIPIPIPNLFPSKKSVRNLKVNQITPLPLLPLKTKSKLRTKHRVFGNNLHYVSATLDLFEQASSGRLFITLWRFFPRGLCMTSCSYQFRLWSKYYHLSDSSF